MSSELRDLQRFADALCNLELAARRLITTSVGVSRANFTTYEVSGDAYIELSKATEAAREVLEQ